MRRALVVVAFTALALTGCAGSDEPDTAAQESPSASSPTGSPTSDESPAVPSDEPTDDPTEGPEAIEIEIEGDRVEPNGMRVKVVAGQPVPLAIESDRAAELHVHSSPEQVIEVAKGTSTTTLTIQRPGIVDVEEHDTGLIVLQLEVR